MDTNLSLKTSTNCSNGHSRKSALKSSNSQIKGPDTGHSSHSEPMNTSGKHSAISSIFSLINRKSSATSSSPASSTSTPNPVIAPSVPSRGIFISTITILSRSKYYLSSLRPGSFVTSLIPVLLGALLAAKTTGQFSFVTLGATLLTVISVHAAGNLVNTYCDFVRGIDSKERRSDDRTLVDSILTKEEVVNLGNIFVSLTYFSYNHLFSILYRSSILLDWVHRISHRCTDQSSSNGIAGFDVLWGHLFIFPIHWWWFQVHCFR